MSLLKKKIKKLKAAHTIAKKTNWSRKKIKNELLKIERMGMPYSRYIKNKCWDMNDDQIKKLNKKYERKKEKKRLIKELMDKSGLDENTAKEALEKGKSYGISNKKYVSNYLFDLNDKELEEYAKTNEKYKQKKAENEDFCVDQVVSYTKWNRDKAIDEMIKMKKKGISFLRYVQKGVYDYSEDEVEELLTWLDEDNQRIKNDKEHFVSEIMNATGWSRGKMELEVLKAKVNSGCSYEDFLGFKMHELTPNEQKTYVTLSTFDKLRAKYNKYSALSTYFDNKSHFNEKFKKYVKRVWFTNEDLSFEDFEHKISGLTKIIVKPIDSKCGDRVEAFDCNQSKKQNKKLYKHIMSLSPSIIEEYIVQIDEMAKFCSTSVNTIRVYTILYNKKCNLIYGLIRMGNGGVVDNFHANGLAAGIDVKKGVVETNAVDLGRNIYKESPSTGMQIKGFKIPEWDKIVSICNEASKLVPGANLVGWDFAITKKGPELIEGNPGAYYVAQLVNVEDKKGLMPVMVDPYL